MDVHMAECAEVERLSWILLLAFTGGGVQCGNPVGMGLKQCAKHVGHESPDGGLIVSRQYAAFGPPPSHG